MSSAVRCGAAGVALAGLIAGHAAPSGVPPSGALAVKTAAGWTAWWRADRAPVHWPGPDPRVVGTIRWRDLPAGAAWGELALSGPGEAWRLRVLVVRLDPARVHLSLASATRDGGLLGAWTIDSAPEAATIAFNAGQFTGGAPWGWVVRDGREERPPGHGPLATAVVVDTAGAVSLVRADSIGAVRAAGAVATAFQSYPTLLWGDGDVPDPIRAEGRGVDVAHRDSRLALGVLRDGRLLVALTRFGALDGAMAMLPFGPTIPEMAAIMGALGCRSAVALDGGISGQLLLRQRNGDARAWSGLRRVPLAVIATPLAHQ